jgi:autotransporter family porin
VPETTATRRRLGAGGLHVLDAPVRIADTRAGSGDAVRAGHVLRVPLGGSGVPPDVTGVLATVTVSEPCAAGYVNAFACGAAPPPRSTSRYEGPASAATATTAMIPAAAGSICVHTSATADLIVDVFAYADPDGAHFAPVHPVRLVDTRPGKPHEVSVTAGALGSGSVLTVPIDRPGGATAVALNVAAVDPAEPGYLTVFPGPCSRPAPNTSNLNHGTGGHITAAATVRIGDDGTVCVFTSARAHVLVDLTGVYGARGRSGAP